MAADCVPDPRAGASRPPPPPHTSDDADTEEELEAGGHGAKRGAAPRAAARAAERSLSPEARVPQKRRRMSASFHPRGVRASQQGLRELLCHIGASVAPAGRFGARHPDGTKDGLCGFWRAKPPDALGDTTCLD